MMKGITSVRIGMATGALSTHGSRGSLLSIFVVWLILWFCKYDLLLGFGRMEEGCQHCKQNPPPQCRLNPKLCLLYQSLKFTQTDRLGGRYEVKTESGLAFGPFSGATITLGLVCNVFVCINPTSCLTHSLGS